LNSTEKLHQENSLCPVRHFFIVLCITQLHDAKILYLKLFLFSVCSIANSNYGSTVCERTRICELHNSQKLSIECQNAWHSWTAVYSKMSWLEMLIQTNWYAGDTQSERGAM